MDDSMVVVPDSGTTHDKVLEHGEALYDLVSVDGRGMAQYVRRGFADRLDGAEDTLHVTADGHKYNWTRDAACKVTRHRDGTYSLKVRSLSDAVAAFDARRLEFDRWEIDARAKHDDDFADYCAAESLRMRNEYTVPMTAAIERHGR
jgi:hypothetical protein